MGDGGDGATPATNGGSRASPSFDERPKRRRFRESFFSERAFQRPESSQVSDHVDRPPSRSDLLRQNAERIRREQADREAIRQLLSSHAAEEADDQTLERFFARLSEETGALPPLSVVLEALRNAGTHDPPAVADQVRLYYRRATSRAPVATS